MLFSVCLGGASFGLLMRLGSDGALSEHGSWASALVHAGDIHVLAAARAVQADVLVTGDLRHFGHLMDRSDLALRMRTVRAFLEEGPS